MKQESKSEYGFSLNDEVYEEEAYGDEGYEDEYYEDEYYDDAYDGEAYADEAYADEEHAEDYYEDDPKTYDGEYDRMLPANDKMGQVLNELAELRRSVCGAQSAPMAASYVAATPYTLSYASGAVVVSPPSQSSSSNEIALYNELTRLREEISKVNSSQEMHIELSRLKEEMEREARQKETMLQEEIRRLNERISELTGKK